MKKRKAGGKMGICQSWCCLVEQLSWIDSYIELMQAIWKEGKVVADWKSANTEEGRPPELRKLARHDVVGKVFARVIQERL